MFERGGYDADGRIFDEGRALDTNRGARGTDGTAGVFYRDDARGEWGEDCENMRRTTGSVDGDGVGVDV